MHVNTQTFDANFMKLIVKSHVCVIDAACEVDVLCTWHARERVARFILCSACASARVSSALPKENIGWAIRRANSSCCIVVEKAAAFLG
jgi:hypothetical protein